MLNNYFFTIVIVFLLSRSSWASSRCYDKLSALFEHQEIRNTRHQLDQRFEIETLNELEQLYGTENLGHIHASLMESRFSFINYRTIEIAEKYHVDEPTTLYKITKIYELMKRIDRQVSQGIPNLVCMTEGFCYGRAMIAHFIATQMGVAQKNMKKVWILGNLRSDNGFRWSYHVGLAIKSHGGLWVLDANHGLKRIRDFYLQFVEDTEATPLIFVTQPSRGTIDSSSQYRIESFNAKAGSENYNYGYFKHSLDLIDKYGSDL